MIKNFSKQPNSFILDERKEHSLTGLIKNSTEKLILIVMHGCKEKFGGEFQKSEKQLANMCLMSRSTFQRNINEMIAKGIVSKRVEQKEGSKENEATYWTVNVQFEYETDQNDTTLTQNDTTVAPKQDEGCPNTGQKEESLISFKELEEEDDYNKQSEKFDKVSHYSNLNEISYMQEFLAEQHFSSAIIKEITEKTVDKLVAKDIHFFNIQKPALEKALDDYYQDYKKPNINSLSGLFVYKLVKACDKMNIELGERNRQRQKEEKQEVYTPTVPFYNWLEN